MSINEDTVKRLNELQGIQWFCHCGEPLPRRQGILQVHSWTDAVFEMSDKQSEDQLLVDANRIRRQLWPFPGEYRRWNDIAIALEPMVQDCVEDYQGWKIPVTPQVREAIMHTVRWDLIHYGIETEYGSRVATRTFAIKAELYLQGRFPCGWRIEMGYGNLVVF